MVASHVYDNSLHTKIVRSINKSIRILSEARIMVKIYPVLPCLPKKCDLLNSSLRRCFISKIVIFEIY